MYLDFSIKKILRCMFTLYVYVVCLRCMFTLYVYVVGPMFTLYVYVVCFLSFWSECSYEFSSAGSRKTSYWVRYGSSMVQFPDRVIISTFCEKCIFFDGLVIIWVGPCIYRWDTILQQWRNGELSLDTSQARTE